MGDNTLWGLLRLEAGNVVWADERTRAWLAPDGDAAREALRDAVRRAAAGQPSLLEWNDRKMVVRGGTDGTEVLVQDISDWRFLWDEFEKHREAARDLEAIFNSSFDEILVIDGRGVTQRINKVGETNYGVHVEEMIGVNVAELERRGLFSPSVTAMVLKERRRVTITQKTRTGKELIVTGNPIFDDNGNISRVVINSRDISELTNLRQKLEEVELLAENYYRLALSLQRNRVADAAIVAASPQMKRIVELADKVAAVDSTVLITGESGVGKGLIAARIHKHSQRAAGPFTLINCGAIPAALLESELFGYERGAFTGANREGKKGLVEVSSGGTVFLDEVAELPLAVQVKLLNLIQERKFYRVGGNRPVAADVRFIAATNRNIQKMVADGTFREDLYYRLNVVPLVIPPLRYRREDIAPLVDQFLRQLNTRFNARKRLAPDAAEVFAAYDWPGNVRELENVLERLMVTGDEEVITAGHLPEYMLGDRTGGLRVAVADLCPLSRAREEVERQLLTMAYRRYGNTYEMAKVLEIDQSTVVRKMRRYRLTARARGGGKRGRNREEA